MTHRIIKWQISSRDRCLDWGKLQAPLAQFVHAAVGRAPLGSMGVHNALIDGYQQCLLIAPMPTKMLSTAGMWVAGDLYQQLRSGKGYEGKRSWNFFYTGLGYGLLWACFFEVPVAMASTPSLTMQRMVKTGLCVGPSWLTTSKRGSFQLCCRTIHQCLSNFQMISSYWTNSRCCHCTMNF